MVKEHSGEIICKSTFARCVFDGWNFFGVTKGLQDDVAMLHSPEGGGWRILDDARSKKPFWHNFSTGMSSWSAPHAIGSRVMDTRDAISPALLHR
jgi:hypothetical protein